MGVGQKVALMRYVLTKLVERVKKSRKRERGRKIILKKRLHRGKIRKGTIKKKIWKMQRGHKGGKRNRPSLNEGATGG